MARDKLRRDLNETAYDTVQAATGQAGKPLPPGEGEPNPKASGAAISTAFTTPTEGAVQFHVSVRVDMSEFAGWQADRIAAFFGGIAQVLAAKGRIEEDASS